MAIRRSMPSVAEVNAANDKLCGFLSDLDDFESRVRRLYEPTMSLEDCAFLVRAGVAPDDEIATDLDPAAFAALLVMLEEMVDDVARMQGLASDLKSNLLALYRESATDLRGDRVA